MRAVFIEDKENGEWRDTGKLGVHSAYEANTLGRLATLGSDDPEDTIYIKHHPDTPPTSDERAFFYREQKYGELVVSATIAGFAERGLQMVASNEVEVDNLSVDEAQLLLDVIRKSRKNPETELPGKTVEAVVIAIPGRPDPEPRSPLKAAA